MSKLTDAELDAQREELLASEGDRAGDPTAPDEVA